MFDFLLSEAFWVDVAVITTIILAAATIIVGILAAISNMNKIKKDIAVLDEKIVGGEKVLSLGHNALSKEHDVLTAHVLEKTAAIAGVVGFLRDEKNKENGIQREAKAEAFDMQKMVARLLSLQTKFVEREYAMTALELQNKTLTAENAALRKELTQSRDPARDAWQEQTDEYDLEP